MPRTADKPSPIGPYLRRARERVGMSTRELADKCGTARQVIDAAERGKCPSLWIVQKIAAALDLSLDELPNAKG